VAAAAPVRRGWIAGLGPTSSPTSTVSIWI